MRRSRKMIKIKGKGNTLDAKEVDAREGVVYPVPGSFNNYPPVKDLTTGVGGLEKLEETALEMTAGADRNVGKCSCRLRKI